MTRAGVVCALFILAAVLLLGVLSWNLDTSVAQTPLVRTAAPLSVTSLSSVLSPTEVPVPISPAPTKKLPKWWKKAWWLHDKPETSAANVTETAMLFEADIARRVNATIQSPATEALLRNVTIARFAGAPDTLLNAPQWKRILNAVEGVWIAPTSLVPLKHHPRAHPKLLKPRVGGRVRHAIYFPVRTCFTNYWHAVAEVVIPLVTSLCRHNWIACDGNALTWNIPVRPILILELPKGYTNFWGSMNKGCPSLWDEVLGFRDAPPPSWAVDLSWRKRKDGLGFDSKSGPSLSSWKSYSPAAWFLDSIVDTKRIYVVGITEEYNTRFPTSDIPTTLIDTMIYGVDYVCSPDTASNHFPFFAAESAIPLCGKVFAAFRKLYGLPQSTLRSRLPRLDGVVRSGIVTHHSHQQTKTKVVELPRIIVVVLHRQIETNGRRILNWDKEILPALSPLASSDPREVTFYHVTFHDLPTSHQRELIHSADIFIAARGAGTVYAEMLRPGTGFLSLYPSRDSISKRRDNFPWWPFGVYREDIHVRFVPCGVAEPLSGNQKGLSKKPMPKTSERSNCEARSANYCDMVCNATVVADRFLELLTVIGSERPPSLTFPGTFRDANDRLWYSDLRK